MGHLGFFGILVCFCLFSRHWSLHGRLYVDMVSNVSSFWSSVKILDILVVEHMSAAGEGK